MSPEEGQRPGPRPAWLGEVSPGKAGGPPSGIWGCRGHGGGAPVSLSFAACPSLFPQMTTSCLFGPPAGVGPLPQFLSER